MVVKRPHDCREIDQKMIITALSLRLSSLLSSFSISLPISHD
jgi:hypothetical protein